MLIRNSRLQPCRCLCRALLHTTYTRPLRRTILQCSQIRLTLVRTFMAVVLYVENPRAGSAWAPVLKRLSISVYVRSRQGACRGAPGPKPRIGIKGTKGSKFGGVDIVEQEVTERTENLSSVASCLEQVFHLLAPGKINRLTPSVTFLS